MSNHDQSYKDKYFSENKELTNVYSKSNPIDKEALNLKNVLVLGSGFISEPCIEYLMRREDNIITIGANFISDSNKLIKNLKEHYKLFLKKKIQLQNMKGKITKEEKDRLSTKFSSRIKSVEIDVVKQKEKLYELVGRSDLVISLVPSFFHIYVMRACIDLHKNLLTTSYIADDFKSMMKEVEEKNLTFMFEVGISPGLDHLIAFKEMREQSKLKNEIVSFESWVGAIPSPECIDNPLYYKFSWDPKGALLTLTYDAKQLINGKVITIPEKHLLTNYLVDKRFHPSLNLEGYYNKNSIKYKELYQMKSAKSVVRGNIRYKGFTFIIQCFKYLNLFSNERIDEKINTWREYLNKILKNARIQDDLFEVKSKYVKKGFEIFVYNAEFSDSLVERIFYYNLSLIAISGFDDRYIRKYGFENLFNRIYSVLLYLELFKDDNKVNLTSF
jgi:saccharopine dehydrogenase-like NADP-dependent oxidoreductase